MNNIQYYIALLVAIIIGFFLIKKSIGCLLKTIVTIILLAFFVVALNYLGIIHLF